MRLRKPFRVALLVGLAAAVATIAFGQTLRNPATMDDLLAELRGLRADLSHAAAANMRMQSLVARLSLQEQRINTLGRQLTDVNAHLEAVTRERIAQEDQLKQFESAIAGGSLPPEMPREDAERELGNQKRQASRTRAREQTVAGLGCRGHCFSRRGAGPVDRLQCPSGRLGACAAIAHVWPRVRPRVSARGGGCPGRSSAARLPRARAADRRS